MSTTSHAWWRTRSATRASCGCTTRRPACSGGRRRPSRTGRVRAAAAAAAREPVPACGGLGRARRAQRAQRPPRAAGPPRPAAVPVRPRDRDGDGRPAADRRRDPGLRRRLPRAGARRAPLHAQRAAGRRAAAGEIALPQRGDSDAGGAGRDRAGGAQRAAGRPQRRGRLGDRPERPHAVRDAGDGRADRTAGRRPRRAADGRLRRRAADVADRHRPRRAGGGRPAAAARRRHAAVAVDPLDAVRLRRRPPRRDADDRHRRDRAQVGRGARCGCGSTRPAGSCG